MDASFGSVDPHIGASSPILNVWILHLAWGDYVFSLYMYKLSSSFLESAWLPQSQWCVVFSSMESVIVNIWNAWFCLPKYISYNHDISLLKIQPIKVPRFTVSPCVTCKCVEFQCLSQLVKAPNFSLCGVHEYTKKYPQKQPTRSFNMIW